MQQNTIIPEATTGGGGDNTEVVANQVLQLTNDATIIANQDEQIANEVLALGKQDEALAKDDTIIANQETQITKQDTEIAKQNEIIVNQTDLNDLIYVLQDLVARLAFLPLTKGVNGEIRVTPLSIPNMATLSNLTTLGNQAQIGGWNANQQIPSLVNMTAKANIDNIIIS